MKNQKKTEIDNGLLKRLKRYIKFVSDKQLDKFPDKYPEKYPKKFPKDKPKFIDKYVKDNFKDFFINKYFLDKKYDFDLREDFKLLRSKASQLLATGMVFLERGHIPEAMIEYLKELDKPELQDSKGLKIEGKDREILDNFGINLTEDFLIFANFLENNEKLNFEKSSEKYNEHTAKYFGITSKAIKICEEIQNRDFKRMLKHFKKSLTSSKKGRVDFLVGEYPGAIYNPDLVSSKSKRKKNI